MPQVQFQTRPIPHDMLRDFCAEVLRAAGLRADDATLVADSLVTANLRGIDSHGVARLPHYLERLRRGSINARPSITIEHRSAALCVVDGDHGLGQLVVQRATDEAIACARDCGAGWAAVKNSSHCGAMAYYGLQIARAGMIGFAFTHVGALVLPYASREPFCGTNPICITAPGEDDAALCLDMATSKTPWNAVANAAIEGVAIPEGWGVDAAGVDTTDPAQVAALYPIAEYKGSGLGLMIDVLCSMLTSSNYGPDIHKMYGDMDQRRLLGGMIGAIDIARFVPVDVFRRRVSELMLRYNALEPAAGHERVQYPGEPEDRRTAERMRDGIPLGLETMRAFDALAVAYELPTTFSARLGAGGGS